MWLPRFQIEAAWVHICHPSPSAVLMNRASIAPRAASPARNDFAKSFVPIPEARDSGKPLLFCATLPLTVNFQPEVSRGTGNLIARGGFYEQIREGGHYGSNRFRAGNPGRVRREEDCLVQRRRQLLRD